MIIKSKLNGTMTLFFCLTILITMALICSVIESARVYVAAVSAKSKAARALESEFAEYSKQVFDGYGVLVKWEDADLANELKTRCIVENIKTIPGTIDFLKSDVSEVTKTNKVYITSNGGHDFAEQILAYEQYAAVADSAKRLLDYYEVYKSKPMAKDKEKLVEDYEKATEKDKNAISLIDQYKLTIEKLKKIDFESICNQAAKIKEDYYREEETKPKQLKKIKTKMTRLVAKVDKAEPLLTKLAELQKDYKKEKQKIEKEYGKSSGKDIVIDNFTKVNKLLAAVDKIKNVSIESMSVEAGTGILCEKNYLKPLLSKFTEVKNLSVSLEMWDKQTVDKESMSIFENAMELLGSEVLGLVKPQNMQISDCTVSSDNLPSEKITSDKDSPLKQPISKGLFLYYIYSHFGNAIEPISDDSLQYGMEYILSGKTKDKTNLSKVVEELIGVRMIFNNIYLIGDSEKMAVCTSLATSIGASVGMPYLEPLIKLILVEAWVLMESISDVKMLLSGDEVHFVKTADEWKTSLAGAIGSETGTVTSSKKVSNTTVNSGTSSMKIGQSTADKLIQQDYQMYLMVLMMAMKNEKLVYRTMDLIQLNVQKKYNSNFSMNRCLTKASFTVQSKLKSILPGLGFVKSIGETVDAYNVVANVSYGY